MPIVALDLLPDDARAWVFASRETLSPDAERSLLAAADAFLAEWRAHGAPLACARDWRDGRFLCIAVDQRTAGASGCSIDGLFRTLRALEPALGTTLFTSGLLFWRADDGTVHCAPRPHFAALAAGGAIRADTPVFDPAIETLGAWRRDFERSAGASWHARWLGTAHA
jgi:hypothetical protein